MGKRCVLHSLIMVFSLVWGLGPTACWASVKNEALSELEELQQQNRVRLEEIDRKMTTSISQASQSDLKSAPIELQKANSTIHSLMEERQEHLYRQDFIDRLKFQIDTNFKGGDLRAFLLNALQNMTMAEAKSSQSSPQMLMFLTYLSVALKNIPERQKDVLSFIEGYMKTSSINKPIRPDQYAEEGNYTNGTISVSAQPIEREKLGELVESKLDQLEYAKAQQENQKVFELRQPVLKGITHLTEERTLVPQSIDTH